MYLMNMNMQNFDRMKLYWGAVKCVFRSKFLAKRPFFISYLITSRCFANCPTCLWRGESPEETDTGKIIHFYRQAHQLGFISTTFWGGEPLIRDDIFEILKACRKFGFIAGLITNGYLVPKYATQLAHNLDFLIISVDIPNEEHDTLRGVPGLFNNIVTGLQCIRVENPKLKVFINSVVSTYNYQYIEQLIRFAEDFGITVTFESVNHGHAEFPRSEGQAVENARLPREKEMEVFGTIRRLKKEHPSINNSNSYLRLFENGQVQYRCHAPQICIRVEPDGNITNCMERVFPLGNVYHERLEDILDKPQRKKLEKMAETCSTCVDSGVIESSLFWNFKMEAMYNSMKLFTK